MSGQSFSNLNYAFDSLELRLAALGSVKKYDSAERQRLGRSGYASALEQVEQQERLYHALLSYWPAGFPYRIKSQMSYPLSKSDFERLKEIGEYDCKWRKELGGMTDEMRAVDQAELPELPSLIEPDTLTETLLPAYKSMVLQNTFANRVMDWVADMWRYVLFKGVGTEKKSEALCKSPKLSGIQMAFVMNAEATQLYLKGLEHLSVREAQKLITFKGRTLSLSNVVDIDPEVAKVLARFSGQYLYLDGLRTVSEPVLRALYPFKGRISFDGAHTFMSSKTHLSRSFVDCLSQLKLYRLRFNGLRWLELSIAKKISHFDVSYIHFNGLVELELASAKALIGLKDCALTLDGLKKVDAALAQVFGSYTCNELHLNGVGALDVAALKGLAQFKGGVLSLNGLTELTERQAWALSVYTGRLEINGVQHISQAALRSLLGKQRAISMRGIKEVDAYSAAILAKFKGNNLYFYGLEDLDSLATKALASYKGNFMASSAVSALIERYQ